MWFGGHSNQLQRSQLHCPWCGIFEKVNHVGVNMYFLVWWSPKSAAKVTIALSWVWHFHIGVNMQYLGCLHWRSHLEVSCSKYALFGLVCRDSFEISSSLPLNLKIKQNTPKSCQIIGGKGGRCQQKLQIKVG